ncbi:hypothetical protein [Escherichia phage TR2]|nr:hypothetical protein [Escherichia phage TR2]
MIKLEHTGACMIVYKGAKYLPGDTIEASELCDGLKRLIAEGKLTIEGDYKATKEVAQEINSQKKRKEPKTISEAETGNEYK